MTTKPGLDLLADPETNHRGLRGTFSRLVQGQPIWLVWIICTGILYARRPDAFHLPQFWAEDGMFFQSDYSLGLQALSVPYNGYHHLIPRLVAAFAGRLDPAVIPAAYFLAAIGLTLYVVTLTLSVRFPFPRHIGYALAVVMVPDAFEVLLNIANIQWVLGTGLVLLLVLRDPVSLGDKIHDVAAAALLGLTGPFSVVLSPAFAVRAWQRRTLWSVVLAGIVGTTALVQTAQILQSSTPFPVDGPILYGHGLAAFGLRTGGSLLLGYWLHFPSTVGLGWALALVTCVAALFLTFRKGEDRDARVMLAFAAGLVLAGGLFRYRGAFHVLLGTLIGARYFYGAQLVLLWLTLTLVRSGRTSYVIASVAALTLFLAANVPRLREPAFQNFRWSDYTNRLRAGEAVTIPTNPPGSTFAIPAKSH